MINNSYILNSNICIGDTECDMTYKKLSKKDTINKWCILSMNEYQLLKTNKYTLPQLKEMCVYYKLKKSGNKGEIIDRLYDYLRDSLYAIKIQSLTRGYFLREYLRCSGPALKDRMLCVNDTDFATLEPVREIPYNQFYSFRTNDNTVYGCDIISLYGLFVIERNPLILNKKILNPYTREDMPTKLQTDFKRYLRLAQVAQIDFKLKEEEIELDPAKKMEMRIIETFQYINELGNYADSAWFINLSTFMLAVFIREIYDIWNYRAQLSVQTMIEIVPPHGNPFMGLSLQLTRSHDKEFLRTSALRIIDYLVRSGHSNENRSLGAYYVLAALTLVSEDARTALPWLFQSVAH